MDRANACVPDMPAAARLFPGAPVVSMRTYVLFPTCAKGLSASRKPSTIKRKGNMAKVLGRNRFRE